MGSDPEKDRSEEKVQGMDASLEWAEDLGVTGLEGGRAGEGVKPVEDAGNGGEEESSGGEPEGGDNGPGEENGGGDGKAGKEEALEGEDDGWILNVKPFKLQRSPDADEEGCQRGEEDGEDGERNGGVGKRGGEDEGDKGGGQREPESEEGTRGEAERVKEVGDEKAGGKDEKRRSAAKGEEECS